MVLGAETSPVLFSAEALAEAHDKRICVRQLGRSIGCPHFLEDRQPQHFLHVDVHVLHRGNDLRIGGHDHALDGAVAERNAQKTLGPFEVFGVYRCEQDCGGQQQHRAHVGLQPAVHDLEHASFVQLRILVHERPRQHVARHRTRLCTPGHVRNRRIFPRSVLALHGIALRGAQVVHERREGLRPQGHDAAQLQAVAFPSLLAVRATQLQDDWSVCRNVRLLAGVDKDALARLVRVLAHKEREHGPARNNETRVHAIDRLVDSAPLVLVVRHLFEGQEPRLALRLPLVVDCVQGLEVAAKGLLRAVVGGVAPAPVLSVHRSNAHDVKLCANELACPCRTECLLRQRNILQRHRQHHHILALRTRGHPVVLHGAFGVDCDSLREEVEDICGSRRHHCGGTWILSFGILIFFRASSSKGS